MRGSSISGVEANLLTSVSSNASVAAVQQASVAAAFTLAVCAVFRPTSETPCSYVKPLSIGQEPTISAVPERTRLARLLHGLRQFMVS